MLHDREFGESIHEWCRRRYPGGYRGKYDITFYKKDYSDVAWDMLDADEREELKAESEKEKDNQRKLMKERGKARYNW